MFRLAVALDVILASGEVPEEIAPVHEVHLVGEEEFQVLPHRRHLHHDVVSALVIRDELALHAADPLAAVVLVAAEPLLVGIDVFGHAAVHAREEHVLCIFVVCLVADDFVAVFFVGRLLLLTLVDGCALFADRHAVLSLDLQGHLGVVGRAVEEGCLSVLLASQVVAQREDVFRRVLVHRRVGRGADDNDGVGRIADDHHRQAEDGGVERACADHEPLAEHAPEAGAHEGEEDDAKHDALRAVAEEGDAQQGDGHEEGDIGTLRAVVAVALIDGPDEYAQQEDDVDDEARVERHAERVDKQQFEPSAHLHDARHDAIEHHGDEHHRANQREQRAFQRGVRILFIVIDQHEGREAEQVEQVDADGQTRQIGDEHQPAVAVRLVGTVFPFQDEPEHHGREQRRVGIHFALDGAEPERVGERVG